MSRKQKVALMTEDEIMHQVETFGYIFAVPDIAPLSILKALVRRGKLREVDQTRGWNRFVAAKKEAKHE